MSNTHWLENPDEYFSGPRDPNEQLALTGRIFNGDVHLSFAEVSTQYNSKTIFTYLQGAMPLPFLFSKDVDVQNEILSSRDWIRAATTTSLVDAIGYIWGEGKLWADRRKLFQTALKPNTFPGYFSTLTNTFNKHMGNWEALMANGSFQLEDSVDSLYADIVQQTFLAGHSIGNIHKRLDAYVPLAYKVLTYRLSVAKENWNSIPGNKEYEEERVSFLALIIEALKDIYNEYDPEAPNSGLLNTIFKNLEGVDLQNKEAAAAVWEMAALDFIGLDSASRETTGGISKLLIHHMQPAIYADLRSQILPVYQGRQALDSYQECAALMPVLMAVREIIRMYPPAHINQRQAVKDTTLLGKHIPAGSVAFTYPPEIQNDTDYYGPTAGQFDHKRMTDQYIEQINKERPGIYRSFVQGSPHSCPGEDLSQLEATLFASMILNRWSNIQIPMGYVPKVEYLSVTRAVNGPEITFSH